MLVIRCKNCNQTIHEHPSQLKCCGCPNLTSIRGGNISGKDLSLVEIVKNWEKTTPSKKKTQHLTDQDLQFQEERKKRKVKRLDFEVR